MAMEDGSEPSSNYSYRILQNLKENPDKTVLVVEEEAVTGLQLHGRISAAVHLLRASGVVPGNRVLITIQPSVDFYTLAVATLVVGGCIIVLDTSMGLERANHCIAAVKPTVWVWSKGSWLKYLKYLLPSLNLASIQLEVGQLVSPAQVSADSSGVRTPLVEPEACVATEYALITFTTGSTGMPKPMLRKHSFLMNQSRSLSHCYEIFCSKKMGISEQENVMCTNLPIFPLHYLTVGTPCILYPSIPKCNPAQVIDTLKRHEATVLGGSPAFVEKIATCARKHGSSLPVKFALIGGAPCFRAPLRDIMSVVPGEEVIVLYGSTEAEPISAVWAEEKLSLEGERSEGLCVGKPLFDNSTKIIQLLKEPCSEPVDLENLELERGDVGEVVVSGWHVNTYQVESKRILTDLEGKKWLRIEDAGYMDEQGRVWLVGRVKWKVEREGKSYWSTTVEQNVVDHCSLLTFAAYLPHNGETWLFLEAPKGISDTEKTGLQQFLSSEGIPVDHLIISSHIPRDRRHHSKPDTAALFAPPSINRYMKLFTYLLRSNPLLVLALVLIQLLLIFMVVTIIASSD